MSVSEDHRGPLPTHFLTSQHTVVSADHGASLFVLNKQGHSAVHAASGFSGDASVGYKCLGADRKRREIVGES